jgi:hypothetical protein
MPLGSTLCYDGQISSKDHALRMVGQNGNTQNMFHVLKIVEQFVV